MATSDILLLKPVNKLGAEGEQVKVRAGYARNFLFPQKLAIPLTQSNKKQIEALEKARMNRQAKELDVAKEIAEKVSALNIAIAVKTGDKGKIFGSVTSRELLERIAEEGIELTKKQFELAQIKTLGKHVAKVKLHAEVTAELEFEVVSENPIEE